MQRRKTSIITLTLLFTIIVSTSSVRRSEAYSSKETSKKTSLSLKINKAEVQKAIIYKKQKLALNDALSDYFKKAIKRGEILGAGVSVVKGDSIIFSGGFGLRNLKKQDHVDANTVFRLGSLSKGFAGVLADMEVSEGKLHWEDKVSDLVPEFALSSPALTSQITLSKILSHSSGVPYHSYTNLVESGMSLTDIAKRFKSLKLSARPGDIYSYQNAIFALSGTMVQKATGETIQQALKEKIFTPLGMSTASTDYESLMKSEDFATPYYQLANGWRARKINQKYYNAVAAGGVNASPSDMAKWMRFLLGHNPGVFNPMALSKVFAPMIEIKGYHHYYQQWEGHVASYYGLGWRIHKFADPATGELSTMMHHGGAVSNYRNEIALFPKEDMGVCILFNSPTQLAQRVVPELHEIIKKVMGSPLNGLSKGQLAMN